jgi:hypothetical protein
MSQRFRERGSALLVTMTVLAVILGLSTGLIYFVETVRARAANEARRIPRNYCSETGLQLARTYFGNNYQYWNQGGILGAPFLNNPGTYNPVVTTYNLKAAAANPLNDPAGLQGSNWVTNTSATHPELFADLDGDGKFDVYIYIRDDADEPTGLEDWKYDSNFQVYVGAVCISSTLVPRRPDGKLDTAALTSEAVLGYNGNQGQYAQRCGSAGNCNFNG